MERMRGDGQQSARKLVRALRSALESADAALDAKFDGLVVAGLEMHAGNVFDRAPIAAPQRFVGVHVECRAHGDAVAIAHDEQQMLRHRVGEPIKERAGEIRRRMMGAIRAFIAAKK